MKNFMNIFIKDKDKQLSLEELIEKYGKEYYFQVDYRAYGSVSVWFGSKRERLEDIRNEIENRIN